MKNFGFKSVWANELSEYLLFRERSGYKIITYVSSLRYFDNFCYSNSVDLGNFSKELADQIRIKPENISQIYHYNRVNAIKRFLEWMKLKGFDVCPPRDVSTNFVQHRPHIYTPDEIELYFNAVDTYNYGKSGKMAIILPVMLRIMYCCGTRIGETLNLKKENIDLESGVVKVTNTKNGRERYIILPDELKILLKKYAQMVYWSLEDKSFLFSDKQLSLKSLSYGTIHHYHKEFLYKAGIPFLGDYKGPRLHDFRHTAIVRSCKQLIDSGMDMYTALPYLAAWAGHTMTESTEYYLRLTIEVYPYLQDKLKDTLDNVFAQMEIYK